MPAVGKGINDIPEREGCAVKSAETVGSGGGSDARDAPGTHPRHGMFASRPPNELAEALRRE